MPSSRVWIQKLHHRQETWAWSQTKHKNNRFPIWSNSYKLTNLPLEGREIILLSILWNYFNVFTTMQLCFTCKKPIRKTSAAFQPLESLVTDKTARAGFHLNETLKNSCGQISATCGANTVHTNHWMASVRPALTRRFSRRDPRFKLVVSICEPDSGRRWELAQVFFFFSENVREEKTPSFKKKNPL